MLRVAQDDCLAEWLIRFTSYPNSRLQHASLIQRGITDSLLQAERIEFLRVFESETTDLEWV
jgi:hypothetical protein